MFMFQSRSFVSLVGSCSPQANEMTRFRADLSDIDAREKKQCYYGAVE